jgi:hypothetical protein
MALHTTLPVYQDTYQLILKVFEYTKGFSNCALLWAADW